jgi:hypothetical protein
VASGAAASGEACWEVWERGPASSAVVGWKEDWELGWELVRVASLAVAVWDMSWVISNVRVRKSVHRRRRRRRRRRRVLLGLLLF